MYIPSHCFYLVSIHRSSLSLPLFSFLSWGEYLLDSRMRGTKSSKKHSLLKCQYEKIEPNNEKRRRRQKRKKARNEELDEASRLQRRTRYLLNQMKLEQNLIDAYSGEGWKGQSRERIKPENDFKGARENQILKYKLGIRDAIRQWDSLSSCRDVLHLYELGSGNLCKLREAFPDNDIILCDGTCNSAFHQKCLDPPLDTESIPPGDQGWFCRFCECRMEILEAVNAHLGTYFSMNNSWEDVFEEEAALPEDANASLHPDVEWPSDDSGDENYDPERKENSSSISGEDTDDHVWEGEFSTDGSVGSDESDGGIEMFGKDAPPCEQISEDEDWGPSKRKRRAKESDAASTLMTLFESEKVNSDVDVEEVEGQLPPEAQIRRSFFRIPRIAVERLREVFAENELPSRDVKENLSKELGLDSEKVSKWFKNARYLALKTRKAEGVKQVHTLTPGLPKHPRFENMMKKLQILLYSPGIAEHHRLVSSVSSSACYALLESMELGDDVKLKKCSKERSKMRKRFNLFAGFGSEDAEAEMERLCKVTELEHRGDLAP
ncbi:hypothetical protein F8388_010813 [Cannabis sativa]|uniref:Pathogenesis-related homeodomain protein n=1 Tax=Cannabis sativa TaxID=3483 RepID=A0A7J6HEK1_CANSA|nr:hypothetical protein F8388_010813 [Cannabis sativa]